MFNRLRNFTRYIGSSIIAVEREMSSSVRYFVNPKPDYETSFGEPDIPEREIKDTINDILVKIQSYVKPVEKNAGDGLYLGTAGIAYMFYHLSKVPSFLKNQTEFLNKAVAYIKPAIVVASHLANDRKDIPSFILGNCGIYAVASVIYRSAGDQAQSDHFRQLYYEAAHICKEPKFLNCGSDELFVGRAGYILGALWLAKETKTPIQKRDLYELCRVIIRSGRDYAARHHSPCPLMYAYYQVEYLGAAHGLCSILQALLSVPGFLDSHPDDAADIKTCIDYLLSLQNKEGNFPTATDEIGSKSDLVHWCHGAGGLAYLMAKAYIVFRDERYLESCKQMGELIWEKGLLKKGPGLCHGVAGNGYVFLLLYRLTKKDPKHIHRAIRFYQFMESEQFQNGARIPDTPYSLYEGLAGTACYLADLTCPLEASFPFSDVFN
ncbi:hypothetical protein NQ318_022576 [Aromia moschata]|uniref:LanC-like protein 3 homolog n=1 Tax=Aromia moschata TaxID=1265417 RepID=A0AAV8XVH2_9CUCU|nr:hypothetical protein NQ318_022576 [Aromia moschata]